MDAENPQAVVDKDAIRQVLINLARNAAEALQSTPAGKRKIEIRTSGTDDRLEIDIEDNGPGIPPTIRSKIFTAFASAEKQAGLGLGLAVTKEIIAVHGGEITAADSPSGGTLMKVALPRRAGVAVFVPFPPKSDDLADRSA